MKPPAFQFYADDFLAGVVDMTQNEVGAYILLLAHGWNTRGLDPSDFDRLKILAKGDISKHVLAKFQTKNGRLFNKRQEHERKKQSNFRNKQRVNGAKGGRPKTKPKHNPSLSSGETQTLAKKSSPSPSPSPSPSTEDDINKGAEFPETPPMSREKFDALATMRAVPKECAEYFWNKHDAKNWLDEKNLPIRKVEPLLLNAKAVWESNAAKHPAKSKLPEQNQLQEKIKPRLV